MARWNSTRRLLFFIVYILNLNPFSVQGELFSSVAKLEKLEGLQEMLYTSLGRYINRERAKIQTSRKLIHDRRRHFTMLGKDARDFRLKSPMDSYLLLKRFLQVWGKMEHIFSNRSSQGKENHSYISLLRVGVFVPRIFYRQYQIPLRSKVIPVLKSSKFKTSCLLHMEINIIVVMTVHLEASNVTNVPKCN